MASLLSHNGEPLCSKPEINIDQVLLNQEYHADGCLFLVQVLGTAHGGSGPNTGYRDPHIKVRPCSTRKLRSAQHRSSCLESHLSAEHDPDLSNLRSVPTAAIDAAKKKCALITYADSRKRERCCLSVAVVHLVYCLLFHVDPSSTRSGDMHAPIAGCGLALPSCCGISHQVIADLRCRYFSVLSGMLSTPFEHMDDFVDIAFSTLPWRPICLGVV